MNQIDSCKQASIDSCFKVAVPVVVLPMAGFGVGGVAAGSAAAKIQAAVYAGSTTGKGLT